MGRAEGYQEKSSDLSIVTEDDSLDSVLAATIFAVRTTVHTMQVLDKPNAKHDVIIGRDLLGKLGIIINFKANVIKWDDLVLPMLC